MEELRSQKSAALAAVTASAGRHDVVGRVLAPVSQRNEMISFETAVPGTTPDAAMMVALQQRQPLFVREVVASPLQQSAALGDAANLKLAPLGGTSIPLQPRAPLRGHQVAHRRLDVGSALLGSLRVLGTVLREVRLRPLPSLRRRLSPRFRRFAGGRVGVRTLARVLPEAA